MRATASISNWIVRLAGTLQLVLGALFWTGHAYTCVPLHIIGGAAIVLALWTVAVLALIARTHRGLALFALLWGLALPAFGIRQATVLIGPMHWIVRVIHLLMGLAAMALAGTLAQAILAAVPGRVPGPEREREAVTS
ncbi:hypothetical protein [Longimicrobium sp.]|uniref:hypothetical protein n=1 Tax=Longimicrobium sp. TaxID=2029185 RepID=UPI002C47AD67|nr:hypothetical protein [Longimicrobium sp.]HSU14119.1 hypothetical protein [Longimicrobium sp.]